MRKLIFYISIPFLCILFACKQGDTTEKCQKSRDDIVSVKQQIKEITIDENDVIIGGHARVYAMKNYLLVLDPRSTNKLVSIFNMEDFKYIGGVVNFGQGPDELANPGDLIPDEEHGMFYIGDYSKMKLFSFHLDSLLRDTLNYKPGLKARLKMNRFLTDCVYINDSIFVGRAITPKGKSDYTPAVAKWNLQTGEITLLSTNAPELEKKRVTCSASAEYRLALETHTYRDLITIVDFDGNIKCNVYGPEWTETLPSKEIHYFDNGLFCKGDKFVVPYSGGSNKGDSYYSTKLMVFKTNGDYVKTLDLGYKINGLTYDNKYNRLIFCFNDEIQFGYLDFDGLI